MSTVIGSARIRILPDSSGFTAQLQGQMRGATTAMSRGLNGVDGALGGTTTRLNRMTEGLGRFSQRSLISGTALTYGLTRPLMNLGTQIVQTSAKFDESLKTIAAVAEIDIFDHLDDGKNAQQAQAELESIGELAIEMGRLGKFGALEMSEGFVEIARAGLQTEDQLRAVGNIVRQVATVEAIEMGAAAEMLINVFTGFGGSFTEVGKLAFENSEGISTFTDEFERMGDVLALVSARTTTNVTDLANAFRYAGPVASVAGVEFEEAGAALGVLAQAGFNATVGGTALRGIITRLAIPTQLSQEIFEKFGLSVEQAFAPEDTGAIPLMEEEIVSMMETLQRAGLSTEEVQEALGAIGSGDFVQNADEMRAAASEMGLEVFDSAGKMVPLVDILDQFAAGGARVGDIMKLFGQRAGPAFLALLANRDAMVTLHDATLDAGGSLTEMTDKIESSATIQFAMLKNALLELAIRIGESGVLQLFTELAQRLTVVVTHLADSQPEIFKWVLAIGALVAAMGPLRIILGLSADALKHFIQFISFAATPLGPLIIAIGAVVGFFALMVSKSEELQYSLKVLGSAFRLVLEPIVKLAGGLLAALATAVGKLAEWMGDKLAPAVDAVSEGIIGWVTAGHLEEWLHGAVEAAKDFTVWIYRLWDGLREAGVFEELGRQFDRLEGIFQDFIGLVQDVFHDWRDAVEEVGEALGTTLLVALGLVWEAIKLFISGVEVLMDILGPIARFIGNNFTAVLGILALKFLLVRRNMASAATGFTVMGVAMSGAALQVREFTKKVGYDTAMVGLKFIDLGVKIQVWASNASPAIQRVANMLGFLGVGGGQRLERLGVHIQKFGRIVSTTMAVAKTALMNAQIIMAGFFSGTMLAQAEDLTGQITALGGAVTSMVMAFSIAPGPIGLVLAALTGIATLAGTFLAQKKEVDDASESLTDYSSIVSGLSQQMRTMGQDLDAGVLLEQFANQVNNLDPRNFATWTHNLDMLGSSVEELGAALASGQGEGFLSGLERDFVSGQFTGRFSDFTAEVAVEGERVNAIMGGIFDVAGISQTHDVAMAWDEVIQKWNAGDEIAVKLTNDLGDTVGTAHSLAEAQAIIGEQFMTTFHGNELNSFIQGIVDAQNETDALQPILDGIALSQDRITQESRGWGDSILEANSALSESRNRLEALFTPQEVAGSATANLFQDLEDQVGDLFVDGMLQLDPDNVVDADNPAWAAAFNAIGVAGGNAMAGLWEEADINPFGSDAEQIAQFEDFIDTIMPSWIGALTRPVAEGGAFGLTEQQARELIGMMIPDLNDPTVQSVLAEQAGDWETWWSRNILENPALSQIPGLTTTDENAGQIQKWVFDFQDLTGQQMSVDQLTGLLTGLGSLDEAALNATLALTARDLPAGLTWDMIWFLMGGGATGLGTSGPQTQTSDLEAFLTIYPEINTSGLGLNEAQAADFIARLSQRDISSTRMQWYIDAVSGAAPFGMSEEEFANLITSGVLPNQSATQAFLELSTSLEMSDIPGLTPEQEGAFVAGLVGGGWEDTEIQAAIDLIVGSEGVPQVLLDGLAGGTVSPVVIPYIMDMELEGLTDQEIKDLGEGFSSFGPNSLGNLGNNKGPGGPGNKGGRHIDIPVRPLLSGIPEMKTELDNMGKALGEKAESFRSTWSRSGTDVSNSLNSIMVALRTLLSFAPLLVAMTMATQSAFSLMTFSILGGINSIVQGLMAIPTVMGVVARSIARGFSAPFSAVASGVWNPFASFINSAANAVGLGSILPAGLRIPIFHEGGVMGEGGKTWGGGAMTSDEMLALLKKGEGVMTEEMMASMSGAQLQEFKSGNPYWWAVGDPYGSGHSAGGAASSGDPLGTSYPDYDDLTNAFSSGVQPLLASVTGSGAGPLIVRAMTKVADGVMKYSKGYGDAVSASQSTSVGLPPGFDLNSAIPKGFDISGWRRVFGAARGKHGSFPLLIEYMKSAGVPFIPSSTVRPGAITATGNISNHGLGRAVDFIAPGDANWDSPGLLKINRAFAPVMDLMAELIYSGPGGLQTKAYTGITRDMHHNHVHAALANGAIINDLMYAKLGEAGPEVVLPLNDIPQALSLARRSGLLRRLNAAQGRQPTYAPSSASSRSQAMPNDYDGGPMGGGPGNTYHIHGVNMDQVKAEIAARDEASTRVRR